MNINRYQKTVIYYLMVLFVFWDVLSLSKLQTSFWNYFYSFSFSLIPLIGGFVGILRSKSWGFLKSAVGKAVFFISAGLLSWGMGSMIWSYYNFFAQVTAPYPSIADVGFIMSIPLWTIGMFNLSKATGAKFGLKKSIGKALLIFLPILIIGFSYYLLVVVARGGVISDSFALSTKLFFDIAYPSSDVIILTLACIVFGLSFQYFGGEYKISIFSIISGFVFMYIADFVFSYTTTINTFFNGDYGDLLFTLGLFFITAGILGFADKPKLIDIKKI